MGVSVYKGLCARVCVFCVNTLLINCLPKTKILGSILHIAFVLRIRRFNCWRRSSRRPMNRSPSLLGDFNVAGLLLGLIPYTSYIHIRDTYIGNNLARDLPLHDRQRQQLNRLIRSRLLKILSNLMQRFSLCVYYISFDYLINADQLVPLVQAAPNE